MYIHHLPSLAHTTFMKYCKLTTYHQLNLSTMSLFKPPWKKEPSEAPTELISNRQCTQEFARKETGSLENIFRSRFYPESICNSSFSNRFRVPKNQINQWFANRYRKHLLHYDKGKYKSKKNCTCTADLQINDITNQKIVETGNHQRTDAERSSPPQVGNASSIFVIEVDCQSQPDLKEIDSVFTDLETLMNGDYY